MTGRESLLGTRTMSPRIERSNRTVHAVTYKGVEIVRYDREGKWYLEWPASAMIPARHIGIAEAARTAVEHGCCIHFDQPGGTVFDRKVRKLRGF